MSAPASLSFLKLRANEVLLFDKLFSLIDTNKVGYATGKQVSNLFITSKLPRKSLAQVITRARGGGDEDGDGDGDRDGDGWR